MSQTVAILGASENPERYSCKAFHALKKHGHRPVPVSPFLHEIDGEPVLQSLKEIDAPIDTLTMYVNPKISTEIQDEIIALKPKRVIFNPGSENAALETELKKAGIYVIEACTLVLLSTEQFEEA